MKYHEESWLLSAREGNQKYMEYTKCLPPPKRRGHFQDLGIDGSIVLKWIIENCFCLLSISFNFESLICFESSD
jgi:hypothetical protein